jgi:hypothetical protein
MSKKQLFLGLALSALLLGTVGPAKAALMGVDLGTGAPPATLGGYSMTEFGTARGGEGGSVSSLDSGTGFTLGFTEAMIKESIGAGWATWSHGYDGGVYKSNGRTSQTLTLAPGAGAFDFWVEPDPFAVITITAKASDGTSLTESINGQGGASGFGFFSPDGSTTISSITITSSVDFAIGEFGVSPVQQAVPEPTSLTLLGIGAVSLLGYGWRRRKTVVA